ncbi:MAG: hypothetical protein HPY53_15335 [Brevinematales bacterium]|nr:hypothetical protein [Brevinematales bacterium]
MEKFLNGITAYLKDWKNWLVHGIIGVAILLAAVFLPVTPLFRILFLAAVAAFNIIRMSIGKKNKPARAEVAVPIEETHSDSRNS